MAITATNPPMWMNAAERFMIEFFKLTRSHMDYSDAIKLIKMGYKNAQSFIDDCIIYGNTVDKTNTIVTVSQDTSDDNISENIIDIDDISDLDRLYSS